MAQVLHATTVSVEGSGLLILGPSGSGKSGLALELMALGAELVADDRTMLTRSEGQLIARAPAQIAGLIEARGLGILKAAARPEVTLRLVVDLGRLETERLPQQYRWSHQSVELPLVYKVEAPHFGAGLIQYLKVGRQV